MLPRFNRLNADRDFSRLMKAGRFVHGRDVSLKGAANKLAATRVGFSVGTKISKRAVVRNLLKRRLREIVRKQLPRIAPGYDLLFMAKPSAAKLDFAGLEKAVSDLLAKSGLLRRN